MNTKRRIDFTIEDRYDGERVLEFLRNEAKASARLITKLKHDPEGIMLNGVHTRTVDLMKKGDILSITLPVDKEEQTNAVEPLPYPLTVFYEDEDLLINPHNKNKKDKMRVAKIFGNFIGTKED